MHLHRQRNMYTLAGAVRLACQSRAISSHLAFLRSWSCFRALSSAIVSRANSVRRGRLARVCLQVMIKDDDDDDDDDDAAAAADDDDAAAAAAAAADDDDDDEGESYCVTMLSLAGMGRCVFMRCRCSQNSARKSCIAMARVLVQTIFFLGAQIT